MSGMLFFPCSRTTTESSVAVWPARARLARRLLLMRTRKPSLSTTSTEWLTSPTPTSSEWQYMSTSRAARRRGAHKRRASGVPERPRAAGKHRGTWGRDTSRRVDRPSVAWTKSPWPHSSGRGAAAGSAVAPPSASSWASSGARRPTSDRMVPDKRRRPATPTGDADRCDAAGRRSRAAPSSGAKVTRARRERGASAAHPRGARAALERRPRSASAASAEVAPEEGARGARAAR